MVSAHHVVKVAGVKAAEHEIVLLIYAATASLGLQQVLVLQWCPR